MASDKHQLILQFLVQRMAHDGYLLTHWDGQIANALGGGKFRLPLTPKLGKHKPDALGFHVHHQLWAISEAKTEGDLHSKRTETQLKEFSSAMMAATGHPCELYFGVPRDALILAKTLLVKCKLHGKKNVKLFGVPPILLS